VLHLHKKTREQVKEEFVKAYDRDVSNADLIYIEDYINAYIESDFLFEHKGILYLTPNYEHDFPWLLNDMRILCRCEKS
jgi:hypothetical protein